MERRCRGFVFCVVLLCAAISGAEGALVAHWRLDETAGLIAAEEIKGKDGTLAGFPANDSQWAAGRVDGALVFDGSDDHVVHEFVLPKSRGTIAHWLWADSTRSMAAYYESDGTAPERNGFGGDNVLEIHTGIYNGSWNATYQDGGLQTNKLWISAGAVSTGTWMHVAATWDTSGDLILYVNGSETGRSSFAGKTLEGRVATVRQFGRVGDGQASRSWLGKMDDVRVYDEALTAGQVMQLYSGGNLRPWADAGADQEIYLAAWQSEAFAELDGLAADDGMPEGSVLATEWTVESGPAGVDFVPSADVLNPLVRVYAAGRYVLRLTADDGELAASDEMVLTVTVPTCETVVRSGLGLAGDISGPEGMPDCRVDLYDLAFVLESWLWCDESVPGCGE